MSRGTISSPLHDIMTFPFRRKAPSIKHFLRFRRGSDNNGQHGQWCSLKRFCSPFQVLMRVTFITHKEYVFIAHALRLITA